MNTGTRIITILAIVTSLNTALMVTNITEFYDKTPDNFIEINNY